MRENGSRDLYVLARVALEAAVRSEDDVSELFAAPTRLPGGTLAARVCERLG
jgi:hypothetical protein